MTPTQLRVIGVALYGPRFASDLACDLRGTKGKSVAVRTVQRWLTGDRAIPAGLCGEDGELAGLLRARRKLLDKLLHRLASHS